MAGLPAAILDCRRCANREGSVTMLVGFRSDEFSRHMESTAVHHLSCRAFPSLLIEY